MKNSVSFFISTIFALSVSAIFCQTTQYDAEYQKLVKEYILQKDGSWDFHYHKEIKLLTYFSFHRLFGETFIVYNPEYQQLKINEAFTVMADGKKVPVPANAFNEVLPGFAAGIPAYNHLREMVVTHTGTEIGSVITLDYTIHSANNFLPFFFGMEEVGESVPVKDLRIIVRVPDEILMKDKITNSRMSPEIIELAGQRSITWSFRDVPALPKTANQDPGNKMVIFFSTAKDMTWAFFSFVNQEAFKSNPGPEITRRVESAIKDKKNDLDKILALQAVVIDELKPADIPLQYSGYKVRTPAEVWKSANATTLERAILLSDMLKIARINAYPVAIVNNAWFDNEMGNLAVFDNFMVQVNPRELGRIYLSVNQKQSQNLAYDLQDKTMIQLDPAIESMRTFVEKAAENRLKMEGILKVEDGKTAGGELVLNFEGICNPYFKVRKDSSYVKNMIAVDFPVESVSSIEKKKLTESFSEFELSFTPQPVTRNPVSGSLNDSGFLFLELPRFKSGFDLWNLLQFTGEGNTPVRLDFPLSEEYSYQISLPSGYTLFTPATKIDLKNDLGELKISFSQSGSEVKVVRSFKLYKDVIASDQMDEFKEMIIAWEKTDFRKIIIENNK